MADSFRDIRDAVAVAFEAAVAAAGVTGVTVSPMDSPDLDRVDLPAVIVSYNGSERETGGTNARDDFAYPIQVGFYTVQADTGTTDPPGMAATRFRQLAREAFHHRRAVVVSGIDCFLCEYDPQGAVIDEAVPAYQQLRAVAVVTVYARVPRGG